jgi:hypothetical protein
MNTEILFTLLLVKSWLLGIQVLGHNLIDNNKQSISTYQRSDSCHFIPVLSPSLKAEKEALKNRHGLFHPDNLSH